MDTFDQNSTFALNDGTSLPVIGFGTYPMRGSTATDAVQSALDIGYRLVDTAEMYENEHEVGEGLRRVGLDSVKVTTKIVGGNYNYEAAMERAEQRRQLLGVDKIDLLLIHWPLPGSTAYRDQWRALIDARDRGIATSIGVSNFNPDQLADLIDTSGVAPAVNQIEVHPYHPNTSWRAANAEHGVLTQAYTPLGKKQPAFGEPAIVAIADAHRKTPAEVILRWHLQIGNLPIPKSANVERQRENFEIFDFALTEDEVAQINAIPAR